MKQILITQEQFHNKAKVAMSVYTDKMKSHVDDEKKYSRLMELSDALTMSVAFALLEDSLFNKGDEDDESNISC